MKLDWNPQVIHVSWNIFASMHTLNPLLTTPHLLLTLSAISFQPLSEEIDADIIICHPLNPWSLFSIDWL